ncbi:MAG TPA: aspartate aminotransferase, partial [Clostridiales bacterium]|nr:aspartate aminotransferase [Clostridiales bacterium]
MIQISEKAKNVSASVTLEISALAKQMKADGKEVIGFTAGEPDFDTPEYVTQAAKDALDKGYTKYTPTAGIAELRNAVAKKFEKDNGLFYKPSQIVVTDGAKSALFHALYAVVSEGDEVIVPSPYWITYTEQIKLCGGVPVIVETSEKSGYKLLKSDFERAITAKTKCVIINSPCNPTGAVYSESELRDIAEVAEKHGLTIISDEIYEKLVFDGEKHVSVASLSDYAKENTVIINGVSKTYSMTGWRIGYLAAPENVAKAISSMQGHTTSNACTFAQYASVCALESEKGEDFIRYMVGEFDSRRNLLCDLLSETDGIKFLKPKGAFYVFADVSRFYGKSADGEKIEGSVGFAKALLKKGVAVIPGKAFGADNCVRL